MIQDMFMLIADGLHWLLSPTKRRETRERKRQEAEARVAEGHRAIAEWREKWGPYWAEVSTIKARAVNGISRGIRAEHVGTEFTVARRLMDGGSYALPYGIIVEDTEGRAWYLPEDVQTEDGRKIRKWTGPGDRIRFAIEDGKAVVVLLQSESLGV